MNCSMPSTLVAPSPVSSRGSSPFSSRATNGGFTIALAEAAARTLASREDEKLSLCCSMRATLAKAA